MRHRLAMHTRGDHGNGKHKETEAGPREGPRWVACTDISNERALDLSALPDQTLATAAGAVGVSIQADGLARVLGNVLCSVAHAGRVRACILSLHRDRLRATGTDGFVAATDHEEAFELHPLPSSGKTLLIERPALVELYDASAATAGPLRLIMLESAKLVLQTGSGQTLVTVATAEDAHALEYYAAITDLIENAQTEAGAQCLAHIDAASMARFRDVRGGRPNQRADLRATGQRGPILIRIGPTFRGIFMPLD